MAETTLKIKGIADFAQITREAKQLTQVLTASVDKKGIRLFESSTMDFLQNQAKGKLTEVHGLYKKLREEASRLDQAIKNTTADEAKQNELVKERLNITRAIKETHMQMVTLQAARQRVDIDQPTKETINTARRAGNTPRSVLGRELGAGVQSVAGSIPRVGGLAGVATGGIRAGASAAEGSGLAGGLAVGGITAAIGGVLFAMSRMKNGFDEFSKHLDTLIQMKMIGVERIGPKATSLANQLGFDPGDIFKTQVEAARAFGAAPNKKEEENRATNIMAGARLLGVAPSLITGLGEQLRAMAGPERAQQQTAELLGRAITSGMDRSQATHWLATTTGLLTELNQSGVASTDALMAAMQDLSAKGPLSPEQAARSLSGIQGAIAGSQGENNVFFQMAAARGGMGGGSLLGTQMAVKQGIMGIDPEAFMKQSINKKAAAQDIADFKKMGLMGAEFTRNQASSILKEFSARGFSGKGGADARQAQRAAFMEKFNLQRPEEARRVIDILEGLAKGETLTKEKRKTLEDLGKTPQEKWQAEALAAMKSIPAGVTKATESAAKQAAFGLGEAVSPAMNSLTEALMTVDGTLTGALPYLMSDEQRMEFNRKQVEERTGVSFLEDGSKIVDPMKHAAYIAERKQQREYKPLTEEQLAIRRRMGKQPENTPIPTYREQQEKLGLNPKTQIGHGFISDKKDTETRRTNQLLEETNNLLRKKEAAGAVRKSSTKGPL